MTGVWAIVLYHIVSSTLDRLDLCIANAPTFFVKGVMVLNLAGLYYSIRCQRGLDPSIFQIPACEVLNIVQYPLARVGQETED